MGIEIREVDTDIGILSCPVFICDQCQQVITDGDWALYQWKTLDGHIIDGSLAFLHKGDCNDAWDDAHNDMGSWSTMELSYFPIYLGNNIGVDWNDNAKGAANMAAL